MLDLVCKISNSFIVLKFRLFKVFTVFLLLFLGCKTKMFPSLKRLAINDNKISQVGYIVMVSHSVNKCIFV